MLRKLFYGFIGFHFLMIALGMLEIALPGAWLYQAQVLYCRVTGAGGSYGFFSPNISASISIELAVDRPDGKKITESIVESSAPEVRVRMGNMTRLVAESFEKEKVVRSVAASFAAAAYRKYPKASRVTTNVYAHKFPSMQDYQLGKRPELISMYSGEFSRRGK